MKLFTWLQPKKKVLFLISLPNLPEFEACKDKVDTYLQQIRKTSADVCEYINEDSLRLAIKYDIVIVVAHHSDDNDSLLLRDGQLMINDFVAYFPSGFKGVLDFSSCYSLNAVNRIKEKCPNCKVQSTGSQASLILRMYLYPKIIKYVLDNHNVDYHEVFKTALAEAMKKANERLANPNSIAQDSTEASIVNRALGSGAVSVYAPKSVKREVPFVIQIICTKEKDSSKIKLIAKKLDKTAREVESFEMPDMEVGDLLGVSISIMGKYSNYIMIDDKTSKFIKIKDGYTRINFCLTIDEQFPKDEIMCKLLMEHNCEPFGECYVSLEIKEESKIPAVVSYHPKDKEIEQQKAKETLINNLELRRYKLKDMITAVSDEERRSKLEADLSLCEKCIQLVCNPRVGINKHNNVVFVSSTSDLKDYRQIAKKAIEECRMSPEMYESWPQTSLTPGDECCRRVMASGTLLCILGAHYGSLENSLGMSMTELEFRTAAIAGIPILAFIIDPLNESNESQELTDRQNAFLNDIKQARVIRFFENEQNLFDNTMNNLKEIYK